MKNTTIALLATLVFATSAQAAPKEIPNLNMDKCIEISEFAQEVMTARQNGEPMTNYLNVENPPYESYRSMVIAAYNTNRYGSEEYKQESIQDFENMAMLACVEAMERRGIEY